MSAAKVRECEQRVRWRSVGLNDVHHSEESGKPLSRLHPIVCCLWRNKQWWFTVRIAAWGGATDIKMVWKNAKRRRRRGDCRRHEGNTENARPENARPENSAPDCRGGKCGTGKCRKRHCMERRRTLIMFTQFCRPTEVNKGTWQIYLLSKWTPLLISTVVIFQAQNRETKLVLEKLLCPPSSLWRRAWQDCISQHNTKPSSPKPRPIIWSQTTSLVCRSAVSSPAGFGAEP